MFVGRTRELAILEDAYQTKSFQMMVIYGRRRIGKTALIREFIKDKPNVYYFTGLEANAPENLTRLSIELLAAKNRMLYPGSNTFPGESTFPSPQFSSFIDAFTYVFNEAKNKQTILVLDEYPYLAKSDPSVSSILQNLIDEQKETSNLFLILCGSSMSFMEHQVLGEKSPLYGRRTGQIKVEPFDIFDSRLLLNEPDPIKTIELYSLVGGIPLYLEQLDAQKSTEWNMAHNIFRQGSFLSAEPENYLMQEMRSPTTYNSIITAIANGNEKNSDIANAAHLTTAALNNYLLNLIDLAIIERITPAIHAKRKQVLYRIKDNLFRFWYRFMPKYTTAINAGMHEIIAAHVADQELSTFVGPAFETVCRQWLQRKIQEGALPVIPTNIGTWWGNDPEYKKEADVDVVVTGINSELILGECKWQNSPVGIEVLDLLIHRSKLLMSDDCQSLSLYLFAKTGFTDACKEKAIKEGNVTLVTVEEMF